MTRVLHLALTALLFVACGMYPDPEGDPESAALVRKYAPVLEDAGLSTVRLAGLRVRVHPGSDGGSWAEQKDGMDVLFDDASFACSDFPGDRTCWVNSLDSPYVGHCFGHVARSAHYDANAGLCVGALVDGMTDHQFFDSVSLDAHCREAAR